MMQNESQQSSSVWTKVKVSLIAAFCAAILAVGSFYLGHHSAVSEEEMRTKGLAIGLIQTLSEIEKIEGVEDKNRELEELKKRIRECGWTYKGFLKVFYEYSLQETELSN